MLAAIATTTEQLHLEPVSPVGAAGDVSIVGVASVGDGEGEGIVVAGISEQIFAPPLGKEKWASESEILLALFAASAVKYTASRLVDDFSRTSSPYFLHSVSGWPGALMGRVRSRITFVSKPSMAASNAVRFTQMLRTNPTTYTFLIFLSVLSVLRKGTMPVRSTRWLFLSSVYALRSASFLMAGAAGFAPQKSSGLFGSE